MNRTRVLVADPLTIFRRGVRTLLSRKGDFAVVEAASLQEFERLEGNCPEIALIDADLPPRGGIAAVAWLLEHCDTAAIVWSLEPTREDVIAAIRAGARGFLYKGISPNGLVRALRGLIHGEAQLSRDLITLMIEALQGLEQRDQARERLASLSPRERQVLDLLVAGVDTSGVAAALAISEFTVKRHVQNILGKLGLHSRADAAAFYRHAVDEADLVAGGTPA